MNDIFEYHKTETKSTSTDQNTSEQIDQINEDDLYAILGCDPGSTVSAN